MRTSLAEIKQAEDYLAGTMEPGETLVFRSQLLINPRMNLNVMLQQKITALVKAYGRNQLKLEIAQLDLELFTEDPRNTFLQKVKRIFR